MLDVSNYFLMYGRRGNVEPPQRILLEDGPTIARDRYIQSLSSDIFGQPAARPSSSVPAGKRFDHSHDEVFAMANNQQDATIRTLKAAPETFIPKDLGYTAKDRMNYEVFGADACYKASRCRPQEEQDAQYPVNKMATENRIPHAHILAVAPKSGFLPSTALWSNYNETTSGKDLSAHADTARDRGIYQGISQVFGTEDNQMRHLQNCVSDVSNETNHEMQRRRMDQSFSNIFNKDYEAHDLKYDSLHNDDVDVRRVKPQTCLLEGMTPFQDAMDSRTELLPGMREAGNRALGSLDGSASLIGPYSKSMEIKFRSHVPGMEHSNAEYRADKITFDQEILDHGNSKERQLLGNDHAALHQMNLRSTALERAGVYHDATGPNANCFNLVGISMRGLNPDVDERLLKEWARREGCHVAKCLIQLDPITHTCKGQARVIIRESRGEETSRRFTSLLEKRGIRYEIEENTDLTF